MAWPQRDVRECDELCRHLIIESISLANLPPQPLVGAYVVKEQLRFIVICMPKQRRPRTAVELRQLLRRKEGKWGWPGFRLQTNIISKADISVCSADDVCPAYWQQLRNT